MKKETLNDTLAGIPQNATDQNAQLNLWEEQSADAVQQEASPYPPGFYNEREGEAAGLWHVEWNKDGGPVKTRIGPCLDVLGKTRDTNGKEWGLFLAWFDDDGTLHTWAMPISMLQSDSSAEYRKHLASEGWSCAPNQRARRKLADFLAGVRRENRILCVPRTGWHDGAYVFPDETIQKKSILNLCPQDKIVLQTDMPHNPFAQQGSLEAWREGVGRLAQGNSRLVLAVSASLGAAILRVCGLESGGFHFMGASSTGKTTTLLAAASAWGPGIRENGFIRSWRATDNGLEGEAALHSDALLCLDEIKQASARTVDEAAYMLANGTGKSRARKDGTARKTLNWRCLVLSTGEESLADRIREAGGRINAGQQVRLLDIPADAGKGMGLFEDLHGYAEPGALADAVQRAAATNYGTAARAFIRKVQECGLNKVREDWEKFRDEALGKLVGKAADGQVRRAGERFLLCAFAGEAASAEKMGILPWKEGEAMRGVQTCFRAWIAQRGGKGAAEDLAIVQQVRLFLEQHGNSRFQDFDSPDEKCQNRAGFRKQHGDTMRFYVLPEVFRTEVVKGYTSTRAGKVLFEAGMLEKPEDPIRYPQKVVLPGMGRTRCYILTFPDTPDTEKDN